MTGVERRRVGGVGGIGRAVLGAGLALLLCAGCAVAESGQPSQAPVPPLTTGQAQAQALTNLGESGLLHYHGTVNQPGSDNETVDLSATAAGEIGGTVGLDGQTGSVLSIGGSLYLDGPQAFWAALSQVSADKSTGFVNQWVKVPSDTLGVDLTKLKPAALQQTLADDLKPGAGEFGRQPTSGTGATRAVQLSGGGTTALVSASPPYGVRHVALPGEEGSKLDLDVADSTTDLAKEYGTLAQQAGQLTGAIDPLVDITQGTQTWGACSAANCTVNVTVTNNAPVPASVLINGAWTGDNAPVGNCTVTMPPVGPGASGTAACTVASPQWTAFFNRAHSVAGDHPYEVDWTAAAIATPPTNLNAIATEAAAAAKPAAADSHQTKGAAYVYEITYQDANRKPQPWKYGVARSAAWQPDAGPQLAVCRQQYRTSCAATLVTAAPDAPSAQALVLQLAAAAMKAADDKCPPGQWTGCTAG